MEQIISSLVPVLQIVVAAPLTAQITALAIFAIVVPICAIVAITWILKKGGAGPD